MDAAHPLTPWLQLAAAPALPAARARTLIETFGSAAAACSAGRTALERAGLAPATVRALRTGADAAVEQALRWQEQPGQRILTLHDGDYPALLRELPDAPLVLWARGDVEVLSTLQLAMVGSRRATPGGARTAFAFARHLADRGLTITSGLALGIDAASHEGALAAGGLTVAVCATGLDCVYPAQHAGLAERIAADGALVSEFPLGTPPRREHFPRRNRLISGLSAGVLVVEAAVRSGSLITARCAAEQGREVFAVPGSIHSPQARGCNALIRAGAKLVETAEHVLEELAPYVGALRRAPAAPDSARAGPPAPGAPALDAQYRALLDAVDYGPTSVDTLVARTGFGAAEVASMLLILELHDQIEAVSTGTYQRRNVAEMH